MSLVTEVRVRCHASRLDAALIDGAAAPSAGPSIDDVLAALREIDGAP
jgi:hypothetical protein